MRQRCARKKCTCSNICTWCDLCANAAHAPDRTPAARTAISGMLWESLAGHPRASNAGHAAHHHAPDRRRAWVVARGVPAAFEGSRPRALADRARHLLGDVERTLLL